MGRFLHITPLSPTTAFDMNFGTPWWQDVKYRVGKLSKKTRKIRIVNTLTQQEDELEVCTEETLAEILQRYLDCNSHAASYTWKRLGNVLDMSKTLDENGIEDESDKFYELTIDEGFYTPAIHLYFTDDLTVA